MSELKLSNFDAVAFDLEGTLADTIPVHHATRAQAFTEHGLGHITKEQHELGPTYGSSHFDILGGILHAAGETDKDIPFSQNEKVLQIIETKGALFKQAAGEGFNAMPGAIEFVQAIALHFAGKLAIVTSSEEEFIHPFLARYDLTQLFKTELVIGHESVIDEGLNVKPSGDPYALAMRRMNAQNLLVFEDTVSGVASAKKAGAFVVALAFDKQNSLLFEQGGLEFPPDVMFYSYKDAAAALGLR